MIALGNPQWRSGGPILGRYYYVPHEGALVRMAKALWEGLNQGPCGTYIRPHDGGYSYGRWRHTLWGWRFDHLGDAPSMAEAREKLACADKAVDARTRQLNKRRRGR